MDSMKKRQKIWPFLAILAIVFPYFHVFATIFPNQVEAVTETQQVIFEDASYGKVEVSYVEKETAIEWKIDYQKYQDTSTNDEVQRLVKLRLEQVANGVGTVKNMNGSELMEENGWYAEKEFSAESTGALTVEMPKEVTELVVEVQMDEQRTVIREVETVVEVENLSVEEEAESQSVTENQQVYEKVQAENILTIEQQGPHQVTAQIQPDEEVDVAEESQAVDTEIGREGGVVEGETATEETEKTAIEPASLPNPITRKTTGSSDLPPIDAAKRAQLATKDGNGVPLTPQEAWDQRLYEITFELDADAPLIHGAADIVFLVDGSGSSNGGTRAAGISKAMELLAAEFGALSEGIRIAILPMTGNFTYPSGDSIGKVEEVIYGPGRPINVSFKSIDQWLSVDTESDKTQVETQVENITKIAGGSKTGRPGMEYADKLLTSMGSTNQGFLIFATGTTINDSGEVSNYFGQTNRFNRDDTFVVQQGKSDLMGWKGSVINDEFNYFYEVYEDDHEKIKLMFQKMIKALISKMKIANIQLTDTLSEYFEIVSIPENAEAGPIFSQDGQTFNVTNIELESNDPDSGSDVHYTWSTTILVKAKDHFVGADVVPTNISDISGIIIPGIEGTQPFTIVGKEDEDTGERTKYERLDTPYVDVKLIPITGPDTEETILLNGKAMSQAEIEKGWEGNFEWDTNLDQLLIIEPEINFGDFEPEHVDYPGIDGIDYKTGLIAQAGLVTTENPDAVTYIEDFGTQRFNSDEDNYPGHNQQSGEATHEVIVLTTELMIDKKLNGEALPAEFTAKFQLELDSSEQIGKYDEEIHVSSTSSEIFTELGVGSYTLTEIVDHGGVIQPESWEVVVKQDPDSNEPKFLIEITGLSVESSWCT
jgi:hypothetical protein